MFKQIKENKRFIIYFLLALFMLVVRIESSGPLIGNLVTWVIVSTILIMLVEAIYRAFVRRKDQNRERQ